MGTQTTPPNQVIMSLALFLTIFIMMPTLEKSWDQGIRPFIDGEIEEKEAFSKSTAPVREFMLKHVREKDLTGIHWKSGIKENLFLMYST